MGDLKAYEDASVTLFLANTNSDEDSRYKQWYQYTSSYQFQWNVCGHNEEISNFVSSFIISLLRYFTIFG